MNIIDGIKVVFFSFGTAKVLKKRVKRFLKMRGNPEIACCVSSQYFPNETDDAPSGVLSGSYSPVCCSSRCIRRRFIISEQRNFHHEPEAKKAGVSGRRACLWS